jgi:hypothetical protein
MDSYYEDEVIPFYTDLLKECFEMLAAPEGDTTAYAIEKMNLLKKIRNVIGN